MKKIILVGSNSDIAKALIFEHNHRYEFIKLSSKESNFNVLDPSTFEKHEKIDGLVYFPGTINLKPFEMLRKNDFEEDFKINVMGLVNVLQFYIKSMSNNASIVSISTVASKLGMKFHSSIAIAKSAIEGLCISLASEYAPKIRINCVAPSIVETKLSSKLLRNEKNREQITNKHPLKKIGSTVDISNLIEFLLSDKSNWITGQVINIDGGLSNIQN